MVTHVGRESPQPSGEGHCPGWVQLAVVSIEDYVGVEISVAVVVGLGFDHDGVEYECVGQLVLQD